MRLSVGLLALSAGLGLAAQQPADVFIFQSGERGSPSSSSLSPPEMPRQLARLLLHSRLSPAGGISLGSFTADLPSSIDLQTAVDLLNRFGKPVRRPLLSPPTTEVEPSQLVVLVEGVTETNSGPLRKALAERAHRDTPSFTIADPPSSAAHGHLVAEDLPLRHGSTKKCDFDVAINPFEDDCWDRKTSVLRYDAKVCHMSMGAIRRREPGFAQIGSVQHAYDVFIQNGDILSQIVDNLDRILFFVNQKSLEATLILLPESSRASPHKYWSSSPVAKRHAAEEVLGSAQRQQEQHAPQPVEARPSVIPLAAKVVIPQCFSSFNRCMETTSECSGHGVCENRYDENDEHACFACVCLATLDDGSVTHWAGDRCQKVDVSGPFWLLTGITLALVVAVSMAVGMLFAVGEEKLPGVIGAGVVRKA